ncbi:hypothetical protein [Pseudarthrobacter cellobiosi]|uniref:hypothetical protein n=1 Tax=Pseudarthrobacter cellobiosi TaxID=2953654 RepID=UPI00208FC640|nr:hypothetical protein [Pseudarthrobacter sp. HLT1-5]MCO4254753.1 hypothetical protein [Pseudarthrobacter sp. HLT1-5]
MVDLDTRRRNVKFRSAAGVLTFMAWLVSCAAIVMGPSFILGLCGVVLLLALMVVRASPSLWIFLASICIVLSSSLWTSESGVLSAAYRFTAIIFIILSFVAGSRSASTSVSSGSPRMYGILGPLFIYLIAAMLAHNSWGDFIGYSAALIILMFGLGVLPRVSPQHLYFGLLAALLVVAASSLAAGIILPETALAGGRLRGLTTNANLLGFYSFCLIALAILYRPRSLISRIGLCVGILSLFWTGSRASLLAVGVLVLGRIFFGSKQKRGLSWLLMGFLMLTLFALGIGDTFLDKALIADSNSRIGTLNEAQRVLQLAPWTGIGLNESVEVASSPLRAFVHAGFWGVMAVAAMWVSLLVSGKSFGWRSVVLALAVIAHSCFEGWMLSPIGPIFMIFMLMWFAVCRIGTAAQKNGNQDAASPLRQQQGDNEQPQRRHSPQAEQQ